MGKLSANHKIDALIAEHIFGWQWLTFLKTAYLIHPEQAPQLSEHLGWTKGIEKGAEIGRTSEHFYDSSRRPPTRYSEIPEYSSDLNQAMWAALAAREKGIETEIVIPEKGRICCRTKTTDGMKFGDMAKDHQDIAKAICLSLIKALGISTKDLK